MRRTTKQCPYCGEAIQATAKKCRHCGEWLSPADRPKPKQTPKPTPAPQPAPMPARAEEDDSGCAYLLGALIGEFAAPCIMLLVAGLILHFTIPDDSRMERAIMNDVRQCVADQGEAYAGLLGKEWGALASMVLSSSVSAEEINKSFDLCNTIEIERSLLWSTGKITIDATGEEATVCFGMLGIVLPFVAWDDFALYDDDEY